LRCRALFGAPTVGRLAPRVGGNGLRLSRSGLLSGPRWWEAGCTRPPIRRWPVRCRRYSARVWVDQLGLVGGIDGFGEGVVITIAMRSHRGRDPEFASRSVGASDSSSSCGDGSKASTSRNSDRSTAKLPPPRHQFNASLKLHRPREARACPVAKRHKAESIIAGHGAGSQHRHNPRREPITELWIPWRVTSEVCRNPGSVLLVSSTVNNNPHHYT
jgi:hypothetical protein